MKEASRTQKNAFALTVGYFAVATAEMIAEYLTYLPAIYVLKPLMPVMLIVLYLMTSVVRHWLFVVAMLLSAITNVLFISPVPTMLSCALAVFTVHRIAIVAFIFKLARMRDFIPLILGTVPFLLIFFYLSINSDIPDDTFVIVALQNVLISVMGGVAVSNYVMSDNRANSWLLISILMFVALQVIVFIEKYYLAYLSPVLLRPIAMGLNAFAFYTFYEYVIASERLNGNGGTS